MKELWERPFAMVNRSIHLPRRRKCAPRPLKTYSGWCPVCGGDLIWGYRRFDWKCLSCHRVFAEGSLAVISKHFNNNNNA